MRPTPSPTFALPLLLALGLSLTGCRHTYMKASEPSDEELFELYTTTATFLYEDDSLLRAQDQAVKALEIDPEERSMRRMIGWIRLRMGSNADLLVAERFFRDLRDEGDDNHATLLGLATALERLGSAHNYASRQFASGEREPAGGREAEAEARALAEKARDHWHRSAELYQEVLDSGEGSTTAMNGLQRVLVMQGDYEGGLAWSERLLARSSAELEVWRRMLRQENLTDREEALFRENERAAVDLQRETHLFVATLLHSLDRFDEAIAHLDAVVELEPRLPETYSLRAQLKGRVGAYQEAIEDLDRFMSLSDAPFEDPDVRRAFELRTRFEGELAQAD